MLGIAKVNIETAGGKSTEASLKYIDLEVGKDIQRQVRELKQDREEKGGSEPVFELSQEELAILSLTSISGKALAGVFVFFALIGGFSGSIDSALNLSALLAIGFTGITSLIIMTLGSAATNFSRYYGFKLFFRGDSLEYERGLINRSEGSIPKEKIQGLSIEENPLQRYFGYATLKVETAGYGPGNQENTGAEVAIPLAEKKNVEEFSRKILEHPGYEMQRVSKKAPRRYFGRYILASTVFTALILTTTHLSQLSIIPAFFVLLVPVSGVAAYLKYVNRGFYEGEGFFYTRNGFWNRKTSIVPYYRIQTLIQEETVFQRRLGLASIVLDTAGTSLLGSNPKACDLDREVAENLFERVYESFQASRDLN
jgi:putative membrane protein